MQSSPFINFLTLLLFKQQSKHIGAVLISVIVIFLLSSVLFISASLQKSLVSTLKNQPDFIISRLQAGRAVDTPLTWMDKIIEIEGVTAVTPRLYGRYFVAPNEESFLIIGVDFFDEQSNQMLKKLINIIDLKEFFETPSMLVGEGVKTYMQAHYYRENFSFKLPNTISLPPGDTSLTVHIRTSTLKGFEDRELKIVFDKFKRVIKREFCEMNILTAYEYKFDLNGNPIERISSKEADYLQPGRTEAA